MFRIEEKERNDVLKELDGYYNKLNEINNRAITNALLHEIEFVKKKVQNTKTKNFDYELNDVRKAFKNTIKLSKLNIVKVAEAEFKKKVIQCEALFKNTTIDHEKYLKTIIEKVEKEPFKEIEKIKEFNFTFC